MKKILLSAVLLFPCFYFSSAQELPHRMTDAEKKLLPGYHIQRLSNPDNILFTTPPVSPVRTIAEWEELQGLLITWTSYQSMLKEIVRAAKQETKVYIVCSNTQTVINYLNQAPAVDTVNVTFLNLPFNSVWSRDYGPWNAYTNDVDTLITIDWIYNRPRPLDDAIPPAIANVLGTPLYQTTTTPWDLVHTGGNFMTDGFGTGFSSALVNFENTLAGGFNVNHTQAEVDTIMKRFMGISRYIKMTTLPYDQIHHIDMHMKLLDEETLLVGQYPNGIADGPQIEANIQYILSNYNSIFGTPFKVLRIPMPADNGQYPNNGGRYLTYTNSSFINKTVIVPTYNIPADTTALRIYRDALPGYTITGINSNASIGALGALHCITKELASPDPLLISHQPLQDTYDITGPYMVNVLIKHRSGIQNATLFYRTDTMAPYTSVSLAQGFNPDYWTAGIPGQIAGTTVYYYIHAQAFSGKQQVRPMPAPAGYWHFNVLGTTSVQQSSSLLNLKMEPAFPNPSKGITCIPVVASGTENVKLELLDVTGRPIVSVFEGFLKKGENKLFLNTQFIASGPYHLVLTGSQSRAVQQLMIR